MLEGLGVDQIKVYRSTDIDTLLEILSFTTSHYAIGM
jgi:hypothetical protein